MSFSSVIVFNRWVVRNDDGKEILTLSNVDS